MQKIPLIHAGIPILPFEEQKKRKWNGTSIAWQVAKARDALLSLAAQVDGIGSRSYKLHTKSEGL